MCTSFVVHGERTLIGMNFDISERPIKLVYQKDSQLIVLQEEHGQFLPAFGINKSGTFMNLHMVEENEAGKYRRGKNCVHIMKLFEDVLGEKLALADVSAFVSDHFLVNVPGHSVQSLIAGRNQQAWVVEPGKGALDVANVDPNFLVMTNFSLFERNENECITGEVAGADRYQAVSKRLTSFQEQLELETCFSILQDAVQKDGDFPTQLSLIVVPDEGLVYFALHANFEKIYCFSFHNQHIRTEKGFQSPLQSTLTKKGVAISELASW
ncbi:hypothetical protein [Brevibacillus choshinensis]|uniref:hypothetical protein n=1 Tax=Brevibacillus choshinensis TaxID=54911 RepID=UPI002E1A3574|nr:hypothetical protein [Brevibacillus choshinensis]MED4781353.1 hypothetical protein [Brevibacillus choshinensis]